MQQKLMSSVEAVHFTGTSVRLLDQRALPETETYLDCATSGAVAEAIRNMVVRGAPAIGIAAAYGLVLAAREAWALADGLPARTDFAARLAILAASRPTAVNLHWALERLERVLPADENDVATRLLQEAVALHAEDLAANQRMGELGAVYLSPGERVLTHCNAGALATAGYGTALGVIRTAWSQGRIAEVYANETRPWLQGARLTAWELLRDGIAVTLLADHAAAWAMRQDRIDWVIVGADRVAANGDVANKIGTYSLALAARQHGVRFMVVAPCSTFDLGCPDGTAIPVEERPAEELTRMKGQAIAAPGVQVWNPVFDVTPAELIDVLVTERGCVEKPDVARIERLFQV